MLSIYRAREIDLFENLDIVHIRLLVDGSIYFGLANLESPGSFPLQSKWICAANPGCQLEKSRSTPGRWIYQSRLQKCVFKMSDCLICASHADGLKDLLETGDQPPFHACKMEVTRDFYESTVF